MSKDVTIGCDPNMKAFFWAADMEGCGWYRCIMPALELSKHYWTAEADTRIQEHHFDYDLVIAQRVSRPEPSALFRKLKGITKIVLELDDLLTSLPAHNPSARFFNDPETKVTLVGNMREADALTVTNELLAEEYSKYNDNIFVLPNCVDNSVFSVTRVNRPKIIIGWAGGASHSRDFSEAGSALQQVMAGNENTSLKTVGWNPAPVLHIPARRHFHEEWVTPTPAYYPLLDDFDIGIAPLENTRFNECKSEIKAIEYGAKGIPIVASKWGPYERYVIHGETGFLAKRHADWVKYLNILINDEELRIEMGQKARELALTRTIGANWSKYEDAYKKVIS